MLLSDSLAFHTHWMDPPVGTVVLSACLWPLLKTNPTEGLFMNSKSNCIRRELSSNGKPQLSKQLLISRGGVCDRMPTRGPIFGERGKCIEVLGLPSDVATRKTCIHMSVALVNRPVSIEQCRLLDHILKHVDFFTNSHATFMMKSS